MNDSTVKTFVKAIKAEKKDPSPYDTTAKVTRVEGNTAWVHISGGVDETPVRMTVNAEVGDEVQVRVGGGKAWITGNATAPPTDDKTALLARIEGIEAKQKAREATAKADVANDKADTATQYASDALDAASGSLVTDTLHYLATSLSSGVTIHTEGWTTTPQTISENNPYLWTYHTYTKASGTQTNTTPVIIGTYGKDGTSVTILGSYNTLAELEAAHPTGSIGDSYMVSGDLYVWNGSAWENVGQIQGPKGDKGATGTSITAVQPLYGLSTSTTVAPSTWSTSLTYETGKYIWTREEISYNNNTTGYSTAIYNQALTQACSDAMQALEVAQEVNQYTWHTETDTGAGAGLHITAIPQDDFEADPSGLNVLIDSVGAKIRNALKTMASYGLKSVIGEANKARVEIAPTVLEMISKDGATAIKIESSNQTAPSYIAVNINIPILYDTPAEFELDNTIPVGTVVTVEILDDAGYFLPTDFTIGTPYTYTDQYGYTIAYDGAYGFTATCTQAADALFTVSGARYTQTVYVPHTTLGGMVKITDTPFNSYSLVAPSISITDTYNGLVVNGVSITRLINSPNAMIDATGLTPVSSRCKVTSGGVIKVGKWRFVQLVLTIKASLSANNTYGILDGFDIANTSIVALASSVNKNYGNVSAQINASGRLVVQTSGQALAADNVLTVSGFYIAQ